MADGGGLIQAEVSRLPTYPVLLFSFAAHVMARGSFVSSRRASVSSASKRVDEKRKEGVITSPLPSKAPPSPSLLSYLFTGVSSLLMDWDYFPWLSYIIIALEALLGLAIIFIARAFKRCVNIFPSFSIGTTIPPLTLFLPIFSNYSHKHVRRVRSPAS